MFNLYGLLKSNNETKQGKIFTKVVSAVRMVVIVVVALSIFMHVLKNGSL